MIEPPYYFLLVENNQAFLVGAKNSDGATAEGWEQMYQLVVIVVDGCKQLTSRLFCTSGIKITASA